MPQLMPLFWVFSVFMLLFIVSIVLMMFNIFVFMNIKANELMYQTKFVWLW